MPKRNRVTTVRQAIRVLTERKEYLEGRVAAHPEYTYCVSEVHALALALAALGMARDYGFVRLVDNGPLLAGQRCRPEKEETK